MGAEAERSGAAARPVEHRATRSAGGAVTRARAVVVPDGMADEPLPELGGRTALQAASTPAMDALAAALATNRGNVVTAPWREVA